MANARAEIIKQRLDHMARLGRKPATQARQKAVQRVEKLKQREFMKTGHRPARLVTRATALHQALARRAHTKNPRSTKNPKPRNRGESMAHRSPAQRAAFRKMIAARKASVAGSPRRRRRRSNPRAEMANPRRRRRRRHTRALARRHNPRHMSRRERRRRRRHNPGGAMMGTVGLIFKSGIPAALAGGAFGFVDAKLMADSSPIVRVGTKIGAAALAGLALRKHPIAAASMIGAIIGSASYSGAISLAGGVSAPSPSAAVKGLGVILRSDRRALGVLIQEMKGMGLQVLNSTPKLGAAGQGPRMTPAPGGGQIVGSVNLG